MLLWKVSREIQRHPFFYEPLIADTVLLVAAVFARSALPAVLGPLPWLTVVALGMAGWATLRLGPLLEYVPEVEDESGGAAIVVEGVMRHPIGAMVLVSSGICAAVWLVLRLMGVASAEVAWVVGIVVGAPVGASYWIARYGYRARNEQHRRRSRPPA